MGYNLCQLPRDEQERVEVEKAAAYAVWKERNLDTKPPAEGESTQHKGAMQAFFLQQVDRYRKIR